VAERKHRVPDPLGLEDAEPLHAGRQDFVDESHELVTVLAVVAVVDLADEAGVRAQPGDDRGALEHGVRAPAEVPPQRDVDRDGLDALDAHGI
jgi:hypothetical protein